MNSVPKQILTEVKKVIHGKDDVIEMMLCASRAGGHVLLQDIPGVGKTTLAMTLKKAMSLSYRRVSFTPDVLPGDILGFQMYDRESGQFRFVEGSIYTNLFLADEINRTSPKTQSALLEVMEERRVTVEGLERAVPEPFFVIATQNPFGSSGTQRLPESQLDRFMVCLTMGYPKHDDAIDVLKGDSLSDMEQVEAVADAETVLAMQKKTAKIFVDDAMYDYIVRLTEATRDERLFRLGLSPRGSIALLKMARAKAFSAGRDYLIPEDVTDVFYPVANHRVQWNTRAAISEHDARERLLLLLDSVPHPKVN